MAVTRIALPATTLRGLLRAAGGVERGRALDRVALGAGRAGSGEPVVSSDDELPLEARADLLEDYLSVLADPELVVRADMASGPERWALVAMVRGPQGVLLEDREDGVVLDSFAPAVLLATLGVRCGLAGLDQPPACAPPPPAHGARRRVLVQAAARRPRGSVVSGDALGWLESADGAWRVDLASGALVPTTGRRLRAEVATLVSSVLGAAVGKAAP